jgi:hypothetical protein
VEALGRVADTLGMMGLGVARNVVLQQRDAMHDIVSGNRPADEGALLDIAGALLYVDASLDDQVARLGRPDTKRRRTARRANRARCSTSSCARRSPTSPTRARRSSPSSKPAGTTPARRTCRACSTKSAARCASSNCRSRPTTSSASASTPRPN